MTLRILWLTLFVMLAVATPQTNAGSEVYTPKPGSSERQAICDAAREHVVKKYATQPLPGPIVFHIDHISVRDGYCFFEATPRLKSGGYVPPNYLPDIAYNLCLQDKGERWRVIMDLSRSDVPEAAEIAELRKRLPNDFPMAVFSPGWREILNRK